MSSLRQEVSETLQLGWPLAGAQLCSLSMLFVDSVIVARLGAAPLAALAMSISLIATLQIVCIGILSPLSALVSHAVGAGRQHTVGRTIHRGLLLAVILASGLIGASFVSDRLLLMLGQRAELVPQARGFLLALAWGAPALLGYFTIRQLAEGVSDTRPSVIIAFGAAVLNGFLDYGLVYGHFGLPRLELQGAGIGTAICSWCMFLSMYTYVHVNPRYREYRLDGGADDDGHSLAEMVHLGLPFAGSLLAEVSFFAGVTLLMGTLGVHPQASHQIALNAVSFVFMIPLGLSFALTIRVSRARGAGDARKVRHAGEAGVLLVVIMQLAAAALFLLEPERIARLYTNDAQLVPLSVSLLHIGGLFQLFDGIQVASMGMLRGLLDSRLPFVATVVSYWLIGMPCALLFTFTLHMGPSGLWYGMVAGLGSAALLLQLRFWLLVSRL